MAFSIGDRLFHFIFGQQTYPYEEQYVSKQYVFTDEKIVWFVFLPWQISVQLSKTLLLIPKRGTVIVYEQPSAMIHHNPQEALRIFKKKLHIIEKDIKKFDGYSLNVLSYSAGNGFGFYIANNYPVKSFISIATGANLGECIWHCIATPHIKSKSEAIGVHSHFDYDKTLQGFIPQDNYKNISAQSTFYLGKYDEYFLQQGIRMAKKVQSVNPKTKIFTLPLGHMGSILYFALLNKCKLVKEIYKN